MRIKLEAVMEWSLLSNHQSQAMLYTSELEQPHCGAEQ